MKRPALLAALALALLAPPGHARGPEEPDAGKGDAAASEEPDALSSMRRHGIIGHVVPPEGVRILDAGMLAAMRDRLIIYIRAQDR